MKRTLPKYRLVICREDLPYNPDWEREEYPGPHCWDPIELMEKARESGGELYREARRIWWEMYWRGMGRYRRGRPFPEVYFCLTGVGCVRGIPGIGTEESPEVKHIVMDDVMVAGYTFGIARPGHGVYRWVFHKRPLVE